MKLLFLPFFTFLMWLLSITNLHASYVLVEMNATQKNHIKAYGVAYWLLTQNVEVYWLLNYEGGSFMFKHSKAVEEKCAVRGVSYRVIADARSTAILQEIADPQINMDAVKLEKTPKIAVYSPKDKQPWDDAVTLALKYAEIPYEIVYDEEIMTNLLPKYDWLHLHHEDFTGQYGRFYSSFKGVKWYEDQVKQAEEMAHKLGFSKVSELKLAVSKKIRDFCAGGGFLFAMCSATDSYDIALAAEGTDICEPMFDGDRADPAMQSKIDFEKCFAFENFILDKNPSNYEFSDIDVSNTRKVQEKDDYFALFQFSAKWDIIPTMLCQNHEQIIKGFMGQTTAFKKDKVKANVLVMGENKAINEARYIHGEYGKGTWTFYGGHDPEDYTHHVNDPPTDMELHPNSPGYRLILNNILFPAAKKKKQKT